MKITIVILHFGDIATTRSCVESLYKKETYEFLLVIVNNTENVFSSKDFTKKNAHVINTGKNLGFAGGVNVGIQYAFKQKTDAVCLLNNDTTITESILKKLITVLQKKEIGIVGPAILFEKNGKMLYDIGGQVNTLFLRTSHNEVSTLTSVKEKEVTYVTGCCMAIKKEVFENIGLFDESFFLYYEDADFCLRAKKKGFKTMLVPSAILNHSLSKSAGKMSKLAIYHLLRSGIIFGKKYAKSTLQKVCNKIFILTQSALFLKANPRSWSIIVKALLDTNL